MTAASKQPIRVAGIEVQFLVDAGDSGGSSTAFVVRVAPGAGTPPPHSHGGFDGAAGCTSSRTSATSMHRC
jgi:hypothetical protein